MNGLVYTASIDAISVGTAEQDLFELTAPADAAVELISIRLGQESEEGDAAAEMLAIKIVRGEGSVTAGSGGTALTPSPLHKQQPATGTGVDRNNTTKMAVGTGSLVVMVAESWNLQIPYLYQPAPDERIIVSPSDLLTVEMAEVSADALTLSGTLTFRDIGG
jgi:hypothetical protein